mmetsp:Transcript_55019/g.99083  ORF Transcript_55019/g.99083 Transcript_55019/m.99083 type:complete len:136 (+) Transcript_55019:326-733(+)|eukprot:CAMPEP_0115165292 /NCGR_PEP_ID=MMETSP0227-20121206/73520_1 /TAXON_ID=89957 /ORGANISM="Polarella glacialis, Strain CCMP 1383" /LENGTH=135 /DNA_ID=CAMNT_0002577765 /DNA_START=304 /DNA_END=711 /DNA_ORIENTATION=+
MGSIGRSGGGGRRGGSGGSELEKLLTGNSGSKGWNLGLDVSRLEAQAKRFAQRSGGMKVAIGAAVVAGTTATVTLQNVPYVPAAMAGALGGAYAVQLPPGNCIGDSTRQVGGQVAYLWDAVTGQGRKGGARDRRR